MKFTLTIECDNAAFEDSRNDEIARILRAAARRLEQGGIGTSLHDANGNKVGTMQLEDSE